MNIDRTKINLIKLQQAVIAGCDEYLKSLDNAQSLANMRGFFHGKKGRVRANKLLLNAQRMQEDEASELLCLVIALFTSNSKGLTTCIAEKVIEGQRGVFEHFAFGIIFEVPVDTLSSEVISPDILDKAKSESINYGESMQESILGSNKVFNKRSGISWILKQISLDQNEENAVKIYLHYLEDDTNLSMLEPIMAEATALT